MVKALGVRTTLELTERRRAAPHSGLDSPEISDLAGVAGNLPSASDPWCP
jgi:hypothetical protein